MIEVRAIQGDTLDRICYRVYGHTAGVTEAAYEANPGLARFGPTIPAGTLVKLPEADRQPTKPTAQLWN